MYGKYMLKHKKDEKKQCLLHEALTETTTV